MLGAIGRNPFSRDVSIDLDQMGGTICALGGHSEIGERKRSAGEVRRVDGRQECCGDLDRSGGEDENGLRRRNRKTSLGGHSGTRNGRVTQETVCFPRKQGPYIVMSIGCRFNSQNVALTRQHERIQPTPW